MIELNSIKDKIDMVRWLVENKQYCEVDECLSEENELKYTLRVTHKWLEDLLKDIDARSTS